jgi:hypothetical protein
LKIAAEERSAPGRGSGGGIEKTLEARSRAPPGDIFRDAIVASSIVGRFSYARVARAWAALAIAG